MLNGEEVDDDDDDDDDIEKIFVVVFVVKFVVKLDFLEKKSYKERKFIFGSFCCCCCCLNMIELDFVDVDAIIIEK